MTQVHFWSDLHLGHEKVSELRGFASPDAHDHYLMNAWINTVRKNDTVWVLGDLCLGSPSRAIEMLATLPGTKRLILGNHDAAHPMHRNGHTKQRRYFAAFDSVQTTAHVRIGEQKFMLSHFPYYGDHAGVEDRGAQYRLRDYGLPLIHGHVHDEWLSMGRQINVGVDHWMDGPASTEAVQALYLEHRRQVEAEYAA